MMAGRLGALPISAENPLGLSWHDSAWIPMLNPSNIMDYFAERSNPFFDRTCNNEIVKMQRLNPEQLQNMTGLEYILLHVQEPILYVIRKQHRHSPTQLTPLANYYIIVGVVYQAPDLASVLNSRLLSAVHHLQTSFEETTSYSRYHPSKGYYWDFKPNKGLDRNMGVSSAPAPVKEAITAPKEDPSTHFQRQRVDMLLAELVRQFPLPVLAPSAQQANGTVKTENTADGSSARQESQPSETSIASVSIKQEPGEINTITNGASSQQPLSNGPASASNGPLIALPDIKQEIKQENMKPPPDKKPRMM